MKSFFLVVNILALTLPFLGAEVQNQDQPRCHENNERLCNQNTVKYIPVHYVLNSYHHSKPNYYQYRPAIPINKQYIPYPHYAKPVLVRPHVEIPQRQVLPNIYPATVACQPYLHSSFILSPPKKIQDKTVIPPANTIAAAEPSFVPTTEPAVSTAVAPEASSEFITSTPETTAGTFTSLMA
ncbi:kappa-casein [Saccopteryx bilineata]|uniref:kappa-casein n=1 Tax=Saccopteryx bilineata TaxID=59482 RepID=UPI00338FA338